jgi:hypothetical protein
MSEDETVYVLGETNGGEYRKCTVVKKHRDDTYDVECLDQFKPKSGYETFTKKEIIPESYLNVLFPENGQGKRVSSDGFREFTLVTNNSVRQGSMTGLADYEDIRRMKIDRWRRDWEIKHPGQIGASRRNRRRRQNKKYSRRRRQSRRR